MIFENKEYQQIPLQVSHLTKNYYCEGDFKCDYCKNRIHDIFRFVVYRFPFGMMHEIYCKECINYVKYQAEIIEKYLVINSIPPSDSEFTIISKKPIKFLLKESHLSLSDAVTQKNEKVSADVVIDRTKYANRESWKGVSIGMSKQEQIEIKQEAELEIKKLLVLS